MPGCEYETPPYGYQEPRYTKQILVDQKPFKEIKASNPNATSQTLRLLNWLHQLPHQKENCLLVGQYIGPMSELKRLGPRFLDPIQGLTGKSPAFIGGDYQDWQQRKDQLKPGNQELLKYWKKGYFIALSWHADNPFTDGRYEDLKVGDFHRLWLPGTPENTRWISELNRIAEGLKELQDAGVTVLWRPFHEMNGDWFWWGYRDKEVFIKLWRQTYQYLTHTKKLNNLLWVYAPNSVYGRIKSATMYYPGNAFVDITALDVYNNHVEVRGYKDLVELGKPFGISEFGSQGRARDGSFNNMTLMKAIKRYYPETRFVLFWHSWDDNKVALVDTLGSKDFLNDPWSQTLGESGLPFP